MNIIGHRQVVDFFVTALKENKLGHSYCFVGVNQIGKRTLARNLASELLNVDEKKLDTHPDFHYLCREINKKTDKPRETISIEQIRTFKSKISSKAWMGKYNVVIINQAELLSKSSGNALLKVLEESVGKTIFFLLTTDEKLMLPTISSRCQTFFLNTATNKELNDQLKDNNYSDQEIDNIIKLSWGRVGRLKSIIKNDDCKNTYITEYKRWQNILRSPLHIKYSEIEELVGKKSKVSREELIERFDLWLVLWRSVLREKSTNSQEKTGMPVANNIIIELIDFLIKAKKLIKQNINPNLVLQHMLLIVN